MTKVILRYEGRFEWIPGDEGKMWTIKSSFIDEQGADRNGGTFGLEGLKKLGIVKVSK